MGAGRDGGSATQAGPEPPTTLPGSLRDFVLANFPLLGAIGGLLSIATVVSVLPFYALWVQPYLIFLLLAAAVLIWLELLTQLPPELLIYQGPPPGTPWRFVGFAYAAQLTMVGLVGGFLWRVPRLLILALAVVIGIGLWRFLLPAHIKARRGVPLLTLIIALLVAIAVVSPVHPDYWAIFEDAGASEP